MGEKRGEGGGVKENGRKRRGRSKMRKMRGVGCLEREWGRGGKENLRRGTGGERERGKREKQNEENQRDWVSGARVGKREEILRRVGKEEEKGGK